MVANAVPNYVFAYLFIVIFVVTFHLFPMIGAYDASLTTPGFNLSFFVDVLRHAFLPILSYFVTSLGSWVLYMRNNAIVVLGDDYVQAAKARGLPESRITWTYVGRNAMLPLFTLLAINIGYIFGGSTLIEYIFTYPGIGYFISRSVSTRDYPLIQGLFFIITVAVTLSNLIADLIYSRLDPRVRFE
jgi:peptide/nickel transport system permease protein